MRQGPISLARTVGRLNPGITFIYVSGQGTDSTERGRVMWARVKGRTENDLCGGDPAVSRPQKIFPELGDNHGATR